MYRYDIDKSILTWVLVPSAVSRTPYMSLTHSSSRAETARPTFGQPSTAAVADVCSSPSTQEFRNSAVRPTIADDDYLKSILRDGAGHRVGIPLRRPLSRLMARR